MAAELDELRPADVFDELEDDSGRDLRLDDLLKYWSDEEIADSFEGELREDWWDDLREIWAREALLEWLAAKREVSSYPDGPLTTQEKADELNEHETSPDGSGGHWFVYDDMIILQGGLSHRRLLGSSPTPVLWRGRGSRRRRNVRRSVRKARAPDDPDPEPPSSRPVEPASSGRLGVVSRRRRP